MKLKDIKGGARIIMTETPLHTVAVKAGDKGTIRIGQDGDAMPDAIFDHLIPSGDYLSSRYIYADEIELLSE